VLRENPTDIDGLGRPFVLPLGFAMTDAGVTQVTESFHLRQDEHLYGLGEKYTPLDKVGQRIITWTQDAFGWTSERSHKKIPFLLSPRGWGQLIAIGARITWDLGVTSCQSYTFSLANEMRYSLLEDEGTTEFTGVLDVKTFTFGWRGGPIRACHLRIVGLGSVRRIDLQTADGMRELVEARELVPDSALEIHLPRTADAEIIIELGEVTDVG
jgi:hypothetical protein